MIESIGLLLATPIAKAILDKFYEGVGSKLGEKAVELMPEKVEQLGKLIWNKCLRGNSGTDDLLQKAANGSAEEQKKLTEYLHKALENDSELLLQAQKLADEIHLEITNNDIQAKNVMNVTDQGQGVQANAPNQTVIQVQGNPNINVGTPPNPK